jgi:WD40 repeat protein
VAFNPDGQILASGSEDATIRLWDLRRPTAAPVVLTGHEAAILSVAFSPDGDTLASGSDDAIVRLWAWPTTALSEYVCQKIRRNLTFDEWQQFVSIDLPYERTCPNLSLHPSVLEAGRTLAKEEKVEAAIAIFQRMLELDPDLDLKPRSEAQKLAAPSILEKSRNLAIKGDIEKALAGYTEAQIFDPTLEISASSWNALCWFGSLWGYAADVLDACDKAVASDPNYAEIRDSRGLARALTGDFDGAIEDFQVFVDWWATNEEEKAQRQRWIEALRAGEIPFTPEVLEALQNK